MDILSSETVVAMNLNNDPLTSPRMDEFVREGLCGESSDHSVQFEQMTDVNLRPTIQAPSVLAVETDSQDATKGDANITPPDGLQSSLSQSFSELNRADNGPKSPVIDHLPSISSSAKPTQPPNLGTSATKTEVLRPHQQLQPSDTHDLVNAIQTIWENDPSVRENGVVLLEAPHLITPEEDITLPDPSYQFEATSQRVVTPARLKGSGIVVIKHETADLKIKKPKFDPIQDLTPDEMEATFHENIEDHLTFSRHPYFNIDIREQKVRPEGSFELTCGSPMDKLSYIVGMNTPYGYYSRKKSHFGAHVEDWHCASYNILFAGATKLWIAIKPSSRHVFEKKVRELFPEAGTCVQFIRHQALNLAPRLLREWGVEHFFVPHNPGQIVAVSGYTYHWGINTGQNYAEAINFCMERDWTAAEDFKNCYPGCGINLDNLPLPRPVMEEGTMEDKKARSFERDEKFRKQWDLDVQAYAEQEGLTVLKKPARKPRTSLTRSDKVLSGTLQDRIAISAASRKLNGREHQRRSVTQRVAYRNVGSSPDNSDDDADDQPPVPKTRQTKPLHSRHNSTHMQAQAPVQQGDMSALLAEIKLLRGFQTDQKAAAVKTEEYQRSSLYYQKRQADAQRQQLEVTQKLLQVVSGMDHRLMLATQALETRSLQFTPQVQSAAPSDIYAPSATTSNNEHSGTSNSGHNVSHHLHRRFASMDSRSNHLTIANVSSHYGEAQVPLQGRAPPTQSQSSLGRQHQPTASKALKSIANVPQQLISAPTPSTQASRRPSLSEHASEMADASPEYTGLTPGMKSLHSTPQLDAETASTAASSLSEPAEESVILVQPQTKTRVIKTVETEVELESSRMSEASESEYGERSQKIVSPKGKAAITPARRVRVRNPTPRRKKCTNCLKKRIKCDLLDPMCTHCAKEDNESGPCVYPPWANASGSKRNAREVSGAVSVKAKRPRTAAASTTPEATPSEVMSAKETTENDDKPQTKPRKNGNTGVSRELMNLFPSDQNVLDHTPGDRRARSKPLQA